MTNLPRLCFRHGTADVLGKTMENSSTSCNKSSLRLVVPDCDWSVTAEHFTNCLVNSKNHCVGILSWGSSWTDQSLQVGLITNVLEEHCCQC